MVKLVDQSHIVIFAIVILAIPTPHPVNPSFTLSYVSCTSNVLFFKKGLQLHGIYDLDVQTPGAGVRMSCFFFFFFFFFFPPLFPFVLLPHHSPKLCILVSSLVATRIIPHILTQSTSSKDDAK